MTDVTELIRAIANGNPDAAHELLPLIYHELRSLARIQMAGEKAGQTLQATALVHEAYLRLLGTDHHQPWQGRGHFFTAAAEAMRRILIENARRKQAAKRGGNAIRVELKSELIGQVDHEQRLLELDDALVKLATRHQAKADFVKLKIYAGLSTEEAGHALGISVPTAFRWWEYCRAWLKVELDPNSPGSP
ncbi:ECF-type sigma factor [Stieleria mannarensis]|uniref:ECF-type sigma factor n=1 Tax=Stieleria mannarensis TaxID=2755585 RepID=UPI00160494F1|nr:ECF-type sigma factor [Rhodopirellula sp. JC639]